MKFYITHYTPLVERHVHITNQLKHAEINDYTVIVSKDREMLSPEELRKFININPAEISLFYKHVEVFSNAPENEVIVVFEDDSVLCKDFLKRLNICLEQLKNEEWDVLFAGECCSAHWALEPNKMVYRTDHSRGTCLYVLNLGVGKRLYDIFTKQDQISVPVDWWFNEISPKYNVKCFWSEPTLVVQGSDNGLFRTSIR
jgi:glycosyl transferase family 25